jgi:hypothetical protein
VREHERGRFSGEVESGGPLAARFNLGSRLRPSKLDLSRPNTADAFVNAMDVMERAEDGVDVDCFALDDCVPFSAREPSWSARCASDPPFDCCRVPLNDVEDVSCLVAAPVRG